MMVEALLFDMDGTLLDIELGGFLRRYFAALGPVLAQVVGTDGDTRSALDAVMRATDAMCEPHEGMTNEQRFNESFDSFTGVRLDEPEPAASIERFYREDFPSLRTVEGPHEGAALAVKAARDAGLKVALATNPIFPRAAIVERLAWAGFTPDEFDVVTSYENMTACKPAARYFKDVAGLLGVRADRCIMVGDDPVLDMAAGDVGMKTFYVGSGADPICDWQGGLSDLAGLIERLTA